MFAAAFFARNAIISSDSNKKKKINNDSKDIDNKETNNRDNDVYKYRSKYPEKVSIYL